MKSNNNVNEGGNLLPDYYDDYANYCVGFLQRFERDVGIAAHALSLQNEPRFFEPYPSCIYTPGTYRDLMKVAGPIIDAACPTVKMFGPEDMTTEPTLMLAFVGAIVTDPLAKPHLDVIASHGYGGDGVTPGDAGPAKWQRIADTAASFGLDSWMTETSGYPNTWTGAMDVAKAMYGSLRYGKISSWTWWTLVGDLIPDGGPSSRYAIHAQYGRYIRPGAVMVESTSDDAAVLVTAFDDLTRSRMTLVLVNTSASAKNVVVSGAQMPASYSVMQTTSGAFMQDSLPAQAAAAVSLPASSVTTLYAPADPLPGQPRIVPSVTLRRPGGRVTRMHRLDGALVGKTTAGKTGSFVGVVVTEDGYRGTRVMLPSRQHLR
jgi:O-glycosyl hydrolase